MPSLIAGISGWYDGPILRVCLESIAAAGLEALYLDGAYRTYAADGPWTTPAADLEEATRGLPVTLHVSPGHAYAHEAEKRTALIRLMQDRAEWGLILDADEVLESRSGLLAGWLEEHQSLGWARVNHYAGELGGDPGFGLPRLVRLVGSLEFLPPRDYELYRDGSRIALLPGEERPSSEEWGTVAVDVARIRHERHRRSTQRLALSGRYARWRRIADGHATADDLARWERELAREAEIERNQRVRRR